MKRLNAVSVMKRLDVSSRQTLRQMVKRGALPPPFRDPGGSINYWLESDIDTLLEELAAKRAQKTA